MQIGVLDGYSARASSGEAAEFARQIGSVPDVMAAIADSPFDGLHTARHVLAERMLP